MKKVFLLLNIIIFIYACENNKKKHYYSDKETLTTQSLRDSIKEIVFFENNLSVPANFELHKNRRIKIDKDSCYLLEFTYKKGKFTSSEILKSIKTSLKYKAFVSEIHRELIEKEIQFIKEQTLIDEDVFNATFIYNSNKKVVIKIEYNKTSNPKIFQPFYEMYFDIKQQLFK